MSTTPAAPTVRDGSWRLGGNRTIPGIRIETGPSHIFVSDENLTQLATDLIDMITKKKEQNR